MTSSELSSQAKVAMLFATFTELNLPGIREPLLTSTLLGSIPKDGYLPTMQLRTVWLMAALVAV